MSSPPPTSPATNLALFLIAIVPVLLGSLFLLPLPLPPRYNLSDRARAHLALVLRLYTTGYGLPMAAISAAGTWISWTVALVIAAVSLSAFGVITIRWIMTQAATAQKMKCRECGKKAGETRFCAECGIEEPLRGMMEMEVMQEEERTVKV